MKNTFLLLTIILLLLFSIVGCTSTQNETPQKNNSTTSDIQSQNTDSVTSNYTESSKPESTSNIQDNNSLTDELITKSDAKEIALKHAGFTATEIYDYEIELDKERSVFIYEISFKNGTVEYDYDINAIDGTIVRSTKEFDD